MTPLDSRDRRDRLITFRPDTPEQKARITATARGEGMSAAGWPLIQVVGPVVRIGREVISHPSLVPIQAEPAVWSLERPRCGNYPASTLRYAAA